MTKYTSVRIVEGKPRKVIVDENGNMANRNPTKEELKGLEKEIAKVRRRLEYTDTDEQLLYRPVQFYEENGRPPTEADFNNDPRYPSFRIYQSRFGSWSNTLKLVELDINSMVKKGRIETSDQKARYAEIIVINHFQQHPVDLAGENKNSSCDGICPNGKTYDVKSSTLAKDRNRYHFNTNNKYKDNIEIYYLLALNDDGSIKCVWRIPGEIVEKHFFHVGLNSRYEFNIENMKKYDITDKFK